MIPHPQNNKFKTFLKRLGYSERELELCFTVNPKAHYFLGKGVFIITTKC